MGKSLRIQGGWVLSAPSRTDSDVIQRRRSKLKYLKLWLLPVSRAVVVRPEVVVLGVVHAVSTVTVQDMRSH
jgi:hypothetical protein